MTTNRILSVADARAITARMAAIIAECAADTYPPAAPISYVTEATGDEDGDDVSPWHPPAACSACGIVTAETIAWDAETGRGTLCDDCAPDGTANL